MLGDHTLQVSMHELSGLASIYAAPILQVMFTGLGCKLAKLVAPKNLSRVILGMK